MVSCGNDVKYESIKIPDRRQSSEIGVRSSTTQKKGSLAPTALPDGMYYEIEYDSGGIPGVGKYVLKPQKIAEPPKDEIRELFTKMRDIARAHRSQYDISRFFDRRVYQDNEAIFYKQARYMKDFTDDFTGSAEFSQYYPYYQMMGYEQLRTYFTWRTGVRKGDVYEVSLSYAFLYIYELLANIGAGSPGEALERLMFFWKAFSVFNNGINKYILQWLKDYHIYYELPQSFKEFVTKNGLKEHYPGMADAGDNFDLFCSVSKYDVRKSSFFCGDNIKLTTDCFYFLTGKLRRIFAENDLDFDESVFQTTKKMSAWTPFKGALFYQWVKQPDRQIVLSENEIYVCSRNKWAFSTAITSESGKQLVGYVIKQMEAVLRRETRYKYKLSANLNAVTHAAVGILDAKGVSLENLVSSAVREFYREATKTVVAVDPKALSEIRQAALATQATLIIPEPEEQPAPALSPLNLSLRASENLPPIVAELMSVSDVWERFKDILTKAEINTLAAAVLGGHEVRKLAGECGVMPEVLVDSLNEKAADYIGDSILDEDFAIYEDYINQVEELIR